MVKSDVHVVSWDLQISVSVLHDELKDKAVLCISIRKFKKKILIHPQNAVEVSPHDGVVDLQR